MLQRFPISEPILFAIGAAADEANIETYVVGGYVRDELLQRGVRKDIDITVIGDGVGFASLVASQFEGARLAVYEKFRTAALQIGDHTIEFVGARKESYRSSSRKPATEEGTLEDDLLRRDFTVNALAVSLNQTNFGDLIDRFEGLHDLQEHILRTPLDPEQTFSDDPLRMMRAARFASQLDFYVEREALEAMQRMAERIQIVSQERITDEFMKIMESPVPSIGLKLLYESGLMYHVFPEVDELGGAELRTEGVQEYAHKDVFKHTMQVVDNMAAMTDDVWLRFAALMHDIAKPRTKDFRPGIGWTFYGHDILGARWVQKIFRRMKLPLDAAERVSKLVRLHMRPMGLVDEGVTDSAVRRLLFEAGEETDDLLMLCRADITSKNPKLANRYQRNYDIVAEKMSEVEEKDQMRAFQSPVRGEEIMAICGIPPSRTVGILKSAIEEAIIEGDIPNEYEAAKEYLLRIKDEVLANNPLTEREINRQVSSAD
ncbi:MAG: CCA tRNA nucleotidyltransferase [Bacteroidota bacterium]|nr:CCA tRNA nucleotidyltransferase [Bacteroidota bacterium]MDP4233822.1 CCA tRNA nucleotidyltransferase [Bacteroidota bacterium]MDP4242479.1 CCA tRNA nucleotidyltransferase [Bacteroidota bacterium]MDP4289067.1 CCA tRNA nucleotidyltransferase [Bacteroidota bacterium]